MILQARYIVLASFEFYITVNAYLSRLKADSSWASSSTVVAQVTTMLFKMESKEGTKGAGKSLVRRTETRG
jgi:hypothetical protein